MGESDIFLKSRKQKIKSTTTQVEYKTNYEFDRDRSRSFYFKWGQQKSDGFLFSVFIFQTVIKTAFNSPPC